MVHTCWLRSAGLMSFSWTAIRSCCMICCWTMQIPPFAWFWNGESTRSIRVRVIFLSASLQCWLLNGYSYLPAGDLILNRNALSKGYTTWEFPPWFWESPTAELLPIGPPGPWGASPEGTRPVPGGPRGGGRAWELAWLPEGGGPAGTNIFGWPELPGPEGPGGPDPGGPPPTAGLILAGFGGKLDPGPKPVEISEKDRVKLTVAKALGQGGNDKLPAHWFRKGKKEHKKGRESYNLKFFL